MEIAMTDKSVLLWLCETLGTGTVHSRKVRPGRKKQWRWRCSHRQAYYVARLLWPYIHIKIEGIQNIIEHYSKHVLMNGNIVNLKEYKEAMSLE
jgi:predicted metal-binding protein